MNRGRRDRRNVLKEKSKGNAVHYTGKIVGRQCILQVWVGHPRVLQADKTVDTTKTRSVEALIDTGATISCIHPDLAKIVELRPNSLIKIGGVGENTTMAPVAPLFVGFPPRDGKPGIARIIPVAIVKIPSFLIFGMDQIMPGVLVVNGKEETWDWKLPNTAVGELANAGPPTKKKPN